MPHRLDAVDLEQRQRIAGYLAQADAALTDLVQRTQFDAALSAGEPPRDQRLARHPPRPELSLWDALDGVEFVLDEV